MRLGYQGGRGICCFGGISCVCWRRERKRVNLNEMVNNLQGFGKICRSGLWYDMTYKQICSREHIRAGPGVEVMP